MTTADTRRRLSDWYRQWRSPLRKRFTEQNMPTGVTVSDAQIDALHVRPDKFHGEWNYAILPTHRKN